MTWVGPSVQEVGNSIPSRGLRLKSLLRRGLPTLLFSLSIGIATQAQDDKDSKQILAFVEAWRGPQDYIWTRESVSKAGPNDSRGIRIEDSGRIRIEYLSSENESVILDPLILSLRYETELPGEPVQKKTSPLEGVDLPLVWLHAVMGFSVGVDPGRGEGIQDIHQAGEVLEILDFRGFVPDVTPVKGKEWSARTLRESDSTYDFEESVERDFECLETTQDGDSVDCKVRFQELVKLTPTSNSRSSEIRERNGIFQVRMPEGLIREVEWRSLASEYFGSGDSRRKIETQTQARILWREAKESKPRTGKSKPKNKDLPPPKPPR